MPEIIQSWLDSPLTLFLTVGLGLVLLALVVGLWQIFGRGPRRRRAFQLAQRHLRQGAWKDALALVHQLENRGQLSHSWQGRLRQLKGECHQAAAAKALDEKKFEVALEHSLHAGNLLKRQQTEARGYVIEALLEDVRRLFSISQGFDTAPVQQLIHRALALQNPCLEASFWQGLCHLREGNHDRAMACLQTARTGDGGAAEDLPSMSSPAGKISYIDPPLYLGALLARQGKAKEAVRYLTEANRIDGNCPFVVWQLGTAMIGAGGDSQLAVRALQRALGQRGFLLWAENPQRAWVEGFPENRSFIRKLAARHPMSCPLWGSDLRTILRLGHIALGQGFYRLGQFQESSDVFNKVLQDGAPNLPVLRGLGLALARLGQYDQAFKHLRSAHEMEEPKERDTAGYLALCGAKGKPASPEHKIQNVTWAIRLVSKFTAPGDPEWAGLVSAIFAEARAIDLPVDADDQVYLCEHLLSVDATDPLAAEAYQHLMGTHPEAVRSEYAWLFCRAAQVHGVGGAYSLALFARTFAEEAQAREFFARHNWDFDAVELTYLDRAADLAPGAFPAALGTDYAARGEKLLLARSIQQEQAQQADAALATAAVLLKLAPHSPQAHDRLAYLYYRRGDRDRAAALLQGWQRLEPHNPAPLVRQAVIFQELGNPDRCLENIRQALDRTRDRLHADIAFLGARLLLKHSELAAGADSSAAPEDPGKVQHARQTALNLLEECLQHDPQHFQALWCLAAVRSLLGDNRGLAQQAAVMDRPEVGEARFQFLAGVCQLAAKNIPGTLAACERVAALCDGPGKPDVQGQAGKPDVQGPDVQGQAAQPDLQPGPALAVESAYLAGWAHWFGQDTDSAARSLQVAAQTAECASAAHAQALLGKVHFARGAYEEAVQCWQALDPKKRAAWNFAETLAGSVFLTALEAFRAGDYQRAADRLREAGRLGWRDRRLGALLTLALVKAGQQLLYQ